MEVSSQALKLHRVDGIVFDAAVFTNLRADHIGAGEHADFAEYMALQAAAVLAGAGAGVFNQDDRLLAGNVAWQQL